MKNRIKIFLRLLSFVVKFFISKNPAEKTKPQSYSAPQSKIEKIFYIPPHEKRMVFLDWGHGGINENGEYTTNGKLHKHKNGKFHDGSTFYEGVFNRIQAKNVAKRLIDKDIPFRFVADPVEDTSLEDRVNFANDVAKYLGKENCLYISFHADAFNGYARGFSVYTSPGITKSDKVAEELFKTVSNKMGHLIRLRFDKSDGDYDKEAKFYVLTQTSMSAILIEHLFFDNYEDAKLLMNKGIQDLFAQCTVEVIEKWHKGLL